MSVEGGGVCVREILGAQNMGFLARRAAEDRGAEIAPLGGALFVKGSVGAGLKLAGGAADDGRFVYRSEGSVGVDLELVAQFRPLPLPAGVAPKFDEEDVVYTAEVPEGWFGPPPGPP